MTSEFHGRREILPVLTVAILLNLVPPYFREHILKLDFPFLDMTGTVFAALLIGPWWAATVGVIGNTVSGTFHAWYFPFILVNIVGGLTCGYLSRGWHWGNALSRPSIPLVTRVHA